MLTRNNCVDKEISIFTASMTARGRVNSWDPMMDDYNDNSAQSIQQTQLNHKKLYVTSIPPGLNEQGLRTAFEKYGQVEQAFLSRDPQKKYGLIRYETAAEARIAMMKLNGTEPLNLRVNFAHAKPDELNGTKELPQKETRHGGSNVSSNRDKKPRNKEEPYNDEDGSVDIYQSATVSSSRRLLPDGRVIVQERVQETDASFTAGAGDSLNIPGLQRINHASCIECGAFAHFYCARCVVAPYCSEVCQRRDWGKRHRAVCHNLTRSTSGSKTRDAVPTSPAVDTNSNIRMPSPPAPLRRPRSPNGNRAPTQRDGTANNSVKDKGPGENQRGRAPQSYQNNNKSKFVPSGHQPAAQRVAKSSPRPLHNQSQGAIQDEEEWTGPDDKTPQKAASPKTQPEAASVPKPAFKPVASKYDIAKAKPEIPMANTAVPKANTAVPKAKTEIINSQVQSASPVNGVCRTSARMGANFTPIAAESKPRASEVALVPSQYLIEKLPIGESFVLSVEQPTSACASKQKGFLCLAMHADYQDQYSLLLGDIFQGDEAIVPKPGSTFAYLDPADEGWYRARCLNSSQCALLDGSRLATMGQGQCRPLHPDCKNIPEFCCVLYNDNAKVSMSLKCTILMKSGDGFKVSLDAADETDSYLGQGTVTRWMPEVELTPEPTPKLKETVPARLPEQVKAATIETKPQPPAKTVEPSKPGLALMQKPTVPDIPRPDIINNGTYMLLHVTSFSRACVRACDEETTREFESIIQDTAFYGMSSGKQLTEPPLPGTVVLCMFEEAHYRALVTRTKASDNRYKVQYAEYGNEEVVPLEKLYHCPSHLNLTAHPARASIVSLSVDSPPLTAPATEYIDTLKENAELIATIPNGGKTAPSGSLVQLSLAKNKENINKRLEDMCTPEWKKLEKAGGDVVGTEVVLLSDVEPLPLPTTRPFVLEVTDFSCIEKGVLSGYERGSSVASTVYGPLTEQINEYCNSSLCSEPYVPAVEEVCLAKLPPYPQWFRAVVVSHSPGATHAHLMYIDYGNMSLDVPLADVRKCLGQFAQEPALASSSAIQGWPEQVTKKQLVKAIEFLEIDDEGRGKLPVKRCTFVEEDMSYIIEAPELIAAINSE